mgnify:CR=1 FL=1
MSMYNDPRKDQAQKFCKPQKFCKLTEAQVPVGSRWKHYKGGLYTIVAVSCLEEKPEEIMVTYKSERYGTVWTRTATNFLDHWTETGEPTQHRFERVP